MKRILIALASLAVAYYAGHFLLQLLLARDLLTHLDECHEELHLKDWINEQLSDSEIDDLHAQWEGCVRQKSNFVDQTFGSNLIEAVIGAMKEDRKKNGPYNLRHNKRGQEATPRNG